MVIKTIFMFLLYFTPYFLILLQVVTGTWAIIGLLILMGIGAACIGLCVMHDANHGAYSASKFTNTALSYTLNLLGGHSFNWKVQHNVLHHTYTNVHDVDEDISPRGIIRMTPESPWHFIHRWQHLYAWFFYGLMTLIWLTHKDFTSIIRYHKEGFMNSLKRSAVGEWILMLSTKAIYAGYIFVLPTILLPFSFWQVLLGWVIMQFVSGFILAIIFQPAHVIEGTTYPMPDENNNLENNWAIHQLHTTTNFGHKHRIFSWCIGGLNYQVEHHLFPNICHVHYRRIAPILQQTAREFGLPYKSKETFFQAIAAHTRLLKTLGQKPMRTATT